MAYSRRTRDRRFLARVGVLVITCTTVLTLAFFGLVAILTGTAADIGTRLPFYVLAMAGVFVATIIGLEERRQEGQVILIAATSTAVIGGIIFTLGGEGMVYAAQHPDQALASQQFLYLVAAGLIATGVGFWGINHWREALNLRV